MIDELSADGMKTGGRREDDDEDDTRVHALRASGRNDDLPQIKYATSQTQSGHECYLLTNDRFRDHLASGIISAEWFEG